MRLFGPKALASLALSLAALAGLVWWVYWQPVPPPAERAPLACRAVAVAPEGEEGPSGARLAGIEDLAASPDGRTLFLSVMAPHGPAALRGLYALPVAELRALPLPPAEPGLPAVLIARRLEAGGPERRPHGIATARLGPDLDMLAVIWHRPRAGGGPGRQSVLWRYRWHDGVLTGLDRLRDDRLCYANDLALLEDGTALVSRDHRSCSGWARRRDNLLARPTGSLWHLDWTAPEITRLAGGVAFANGVAATGDRVHLAASRGRRVLSWDRGALLTGETGAPLASPVAGAPDNLTALADGTLLVAALPSMGQTAARMTRLVPGIAPPSRILRLDPASGEQTLLVEDPKAALIAGATVAQPAGGRLILAGVFGEGLAVCGGLAEARG